MKRPLITLIAFWGTVALGASAAYAAKHEGTTGKQEMRQEQMKDKDVPCPDEAKEKKEMKKKTTEKKGATPAPPATPSQPPKN